jgi:hypothetical protein
MVAATTGSSYLAGIPSLPDVLLAVPHEELPHRQRLLERRLTREILEKIRQARAAHEAVHGPIDVEPPTQPFKRRH